MPLLVLVRVDSVLISLYGGSVKQSSALEARDVWAR